MAVCKMMIKSAGACVPHHVKLDVAADVERVDADPLARHVGQCDVNLGEGNVALVIRTRHQSRITWSRTLMGSCSPRDVSTASSLSTCTVIKYSVGTLGVALEHLVNGHRRTEL